MQYYILATNWYFLDKNNNVTICQLIFKNVLCDRIVYIALLDNDRHVDSSLTDVSSLSFSGCPAEDDRQECRNPFNVFQGCMRLLTLDNQNVDLIMVQQKQLGIYSNLQIDMCGIIDRSVSKKDFQKSDIC